jgi:hypothetical protein
MPNAIGRQTAPAPLGWIQYGKVINFAPADRSDDLGAVGASSALL